MLDMGLDELTEFIKQLGQPAYRARQIWQWIYQRFANDFEQMSNLPQPLRAQLAERRCSIGGQVGPSIAYVRTQDR